MMLLEVSGITCAYDGVNVLRDVTLRVEPGDVLGVIGPNGAGKSTLIRSMSRVLRPKLGRALLDERDLYDEVSASEAAKSIAVVPQDSPSPFEFTAREIVLMGRSPHLKRFQQEGPRDLEIVQRSMERTETWDLRDRPVTELSGGERQRVVLARAFAQEPRTLLLDEPTTHLDLGHQVQIMKCVRELECAVVSVMHDLNLAAGFCTRLVLLEAGRIAAAGSPAEVLTRENLERIYRIPIVIDQKNGTLTVLPKIS